MPFRIGIAVITTCYFFDLEPFDAGDVKIFDWQNLFRWYIGSVEFDIADWRVETSNVIEFCFNDQGHIDVIIKIDCF